MIKKHLVRLTGLLAVIFVLSACSQTTASDSDSAGAEQEERTTPVEVAEVTVGDLQMEREINGTATMSKSSEIIPKGQGELIELSIEKGDVVEKGQIIGRLDADSIQDNVKLQELAVKSAQKQLESAQVQKNLAEQGVKNAEEQLKQAKASDMDNENDRSNADINVENAKLQLELAETNLARMEALYEEGAISLSELEQAQVNEQQARNSYQQAVNTYESTSDQIDTGDITTESSITQAEIAVENAKQQLESAIIQVEASQLQVDQASVQLSQIEDQLVDTTIKANASGEITVLNADVGDMVSNTQSMGTIIALDPITINANVNANELSLFEIGQEMNVYVRALDLSATATVSYVSPMANETGLYLVEAELANEDKAVKPGMMVKFQLPTTIVEEAILVPTAAVVEEAEGAFVYVIEEERAVKKEITIVNTQSDISAISGDLNQGDQVVTSGQITLSDGNKITIIEEAAN